MNFGTNNSLRNNLANQIGENAENLFFKRSGSCKECKQHVKEFQMIVRNSKNTNKLKTKIE